MEGDARDQLQPQPWIVGEIGANGFSAGEEHVDSLSLRVSRPLCQLRLSRRASASV
jgi:hypothetical protein